MKGKDAQLRARAQSVLAMAEKRGSVLTSSISTSSNGMGSPTPPSSRKSILGDLFEKEEEDSEEDDQLNLSLSLNDNSEEFLEEGKDVWLEGNDGVKVGANRAELAAKSKIFQRLLLGSFVMSSDGSFQSVKFDFTGSTLKAVVEFVMTDNTKVLDIQTIQEEKRRGSLKSVQSLPAVPHKSKGIFDFFSRSNANGNISSNKSVTSLRSANSHHSYHITYSPQQLQTLVSLTRAAVYFRLPALGIQSNNTLTHYLQRSPSSAFTVLEACRQEPPPVPNEILGIALSSIRNFVGPIETGSVEFLSPSTIQEILRDDKLRMDDYQLFSLVKRWANAKKSTKNSLRLPDDTKASDTLAEEVSQLTPQQRKHIAIQQLMPLVRLECIDPPVLANSVATTDLVTQEQLLQAFQQQALAAHLRANIAFQKPRNTKARWKKSMSNTFVSRYDNEFKEDVLGNYPPIQTGIHQWTVVVEESGDFTWLGISISKYFVADDDMDSSHNPDGGDGNMEHQHEREEEDTNATLQDRNWVYSNHGEACHGGKLVQSAGVIPGFGTGSHVTFTLYLHWKDHGTLLASVDGSQEYALFTGLRKSLQEGEGFLPTVSMHSPGRVRLVDIRHVRSHPNILNKLSTAL